jgi:hypothetical protein
MNGMKRPVTEEFVLITESSTNSEGVPIGVRDTGRISCMTTQSVRMFSYRSAKV